MKQTNYVLVALTVGALCAEAAFMCKIPFGKAQTLVANVRDFGAMGDGVTDDTQAIQNAIDSLASNGGTVLLPAGVYAVPRGPLLLTASHTHMTGEGTGSTTLIYDHVYRAISIGQTKTGASGIEDLSVQNLRIVGTAASPGDAAAGRGAVTIDGYVAPVSNVLIAHVQIDAAPTAGIAVTGTGVSIDHVRIQRTGEHGIYFSGNGTTNGGWGTIRKSSISTSGVGSPICCSAAIKLADVSHVIVENNTISEPQAYGLLIDRAATDIIAKDNFFTMRTCAPDDRSCDTQTAIRNNTGQGVVLTGNVVDGGNGTPYGRAYWFNAGVGTFVQDAEIRGKWNVPAIRLEAESQRSTFDALSLTGEQAGNVAMDVYAPDTAAYRFSLPAGQTIDTHGGTSLPLARAPCTESSATAPVPLGMRAGTVVYRLDFSGCSLLPPGSTVLVRTSPGLTRHPFGQVLLRNQRGDLVPYLYYRYSDVAATYEHSLAGTESAFLASRFGASTPVQLERDLRATVQALQNRYGIPRWQSANDAPSALWLEPDALYVIRNFSLDPALMDALP